MSKSESNEKPDGLCWSAVLLDPKTFLGTGRIVDPGVTRLLEDATRAGGGVSNAVIGGMVRVYVSKMTPDEAKDWMKAVFVDPPREVVGEFVKERAARRLLTSK